MSTNEPARTDDIPHETILTCKQVSNLMGMKHSCNVRKRGYRDRIYDCESLDKEEDRIFVCQLCYLKSGENNRLSESTSDEHTLQNFRTSFNSATKVQICRIYESTLKRTIRKKIPTRSQP